MIAALGRETRSAPSPHRTVVLLPLAVFVTAVVLAGIRSGWNLVDDALIFCRYAANVAHGSGWVFNPGEPVEGHSSPLWVFLLSLGGRLGMDLPSLARTLGIVAGGGVVLLTARACQRLAPGRIGLALALVVAADGGLATWSISGMETSAFVLIASAAVYSASRPCSTGTPGAAAPTGILAGLLCVARPEGILLGGVLILAVLITLPRASRRPPIFIALLLPYAFAAGSITAWRLSGYGAVVPLPLVAKWTPRLDAVTNGIVQLLFFSVTRLPLVLLAALALAEARRRGSLASLLPGVVALLFLAIETVLAGGDWMGHDRYLLAALPVLALLAAKESDPLRNVRAPASGLLVLSILAAGMTWAFGDRIPPHERAAEELGLWLRAHETLDTRLGVAAAGAVPFYSGLYAIDALGITDPVTARTPPAPGAPWKPGHMRYDLDRFLAQHPDVIVWEFGRAWCEARLREPAGSGKHSGDYRRELLASPVFRERYQLAAGAPPETERYFTVFRARVGEEPRPE